MGTAVVGLSSIGPVLAANPWSAVKQGLYVCLATRDLGDHLWSFGTDREGKGQAGEATLFAGLHYDDGQGALRLLEQAFGFRPGLVVPGPDGTIAHAELHMGADTLMIGSAPKDEALWNGHNQTACVFVFDPDQHFTQASMAGAVIIRPLETTSDGARGYVARDIEGFVWNFSNYKPSA